MNILYLNHNVVWRSTFHRCFLFARELVRLGHDVTILTNSPTARWRFKEYVYDGVRIVESPDWFWGSLRTGWDPINVVRRCWYLRTQSFGLIHAFDTRPTVILPALFYKFAVRSVPLVIDWGDWWGHGGVITMRKNKALNILFSPLETFFEEFFRRYANYTTVVSKLLHKRAKQLGIPTKKLLIVPNGVDIRAIYISKNLARERLRIPATAHVFIYPSFVLYDFHFILEAFLKLYKRDKHALLLLIGEFPRSLGQPYDSLIQKSTIRDYGNVDRKKLFTYLSASDVGLLPLSDTIANRARFPIKFGEFVSAKIPLITNNVGDIGFLVKKYKLGLLSSYFPDQFAQKMFFSVIHPRVVRQHAKRAYKFAHTHLSWELLAKQLLDTYSFLIREH